MGRKCNVLDCPSDSRRIEDNGVTFHKMPFHPDLRPKWLELCRIPDDRKTCKIIYVCSRHFRRTDFCNFKGTKYMLRQGALPSVFPWTKSITKLPVLPAASNKPTDTQSEMDEDIEIKTEPVDEQQSKDLEERTDDTFDEMVIKKEIKTEPQDAVESVNSINFMSGTRIEANDFNDKWYPASIVEVDYEENEVLVEFDKHLNRANEWIPMDSSRLRPFQARANVEYFSVGERVLATWTETCNKFPATVRCILEGDSYEVLFDDGFTKVLKHHKMAKVKDALVKPAVHIAPLFDPVVGSKEERRERKRKINVAELFGVSKKKTKQDDAKLEGNDEEKLSQEEYPTSTGSLSQYEGEEWTCRWLNGEPVGVESTIDSNEGSKRSIIVADHRLPPGWEKHFAQRVSGNNIGKWDAILVNPNGKRFHSKNSIKNWLEDNNSEYHIDQFDFCLHLNRARKLGLYELPTKMPIGKFARTKGNTLKARGLPIPRSTLLTPKVEPEEPDECGLKIIMENDSYKCPIEGCGKNFRKENLAQMHIKHYHPEYSKLMGSTPNVADLAYARTVGESMDEHTPKIRHPAPIKLESTPKPKSNTLKVITPKIPSIKQEDIEQKITDTPRPPGKDTEIIKLLNSEPKLKTLDAIFDQQDLVSSKVATPQDKYPEIKLKDLLHKSEPIPMKKDDYRPTGIKTLLPVIRPPIIDEIKSEEIDMEPPAQFKIYDKPRPGRKRQGSENQDNFKRRRQSVKYEMDEDYYEGDADSQDSFKQAEPIPASTVVTTQESPEVIIEGGEVIRLVHMRSEEIINCTCGITEEDGLMIQCELCLCWQHAHCNNIQRENQVPDKYVCKICKNPLRMRASKKYIHDQDWLKQGTLASASFHTKDEQQFATRFEKLRKTHELSGCLLELNEYVHNLRIKLNIAENKDHPKLYLWAKPWDKTQPEGTLNLIKEEIKSEDAAEHSYMKGGSTFGDVALKSMLQPPEIKNEADQKLVDSKIESQSELISILEDTDDDEAKSEYPKIDLNQMMIKEEQKDGINDQLMDDDNNKENVMNSVTTGILSAGSLELALSQSDLERLSTLAQLSVAMAPQPEAPIDSADCRMNLLDHVAYYQNLVEERLNSIESEINDLEEAEPDIVASNDNVENYPKTKQTLQMLIRDLSTMRQIATLTH